MHKVVKLVSFIFALGVVATASAQENKFLDRSFWKTNPSISEIENLIANGHEITELNEHMFDPVCYALMEKVDNATVKYMMEKEGNEMDKLTHDGRTYIFWAAYRDNLEIMEYLVGKGAKANIEDSHGYSVLNFAAVTGQTNPQLYDFLLANDADIHATNHNGANALLLVSSFAKDFDILSYFVEKGLSLENIDNDGNGIFQYAAKGGQIPLLKTLVDKGVAYDKINKKGENAIFMAAQGTRGTQNSDEVFKYLENLGLELNLANQDNSTPLHHIAGQNRELEVFNHFIQDGADAGLQDKEGLTPFMNAAKANSLEVVSLLAKQIEDMNATDKKGRSALAFAVADNSQEVVDFLIKNGAEVGVEDHDSNTLAFYLIQDYDAGNPDNFEVKLKLLTVAGFQMNHAQNQGNTLVHLAAKENNLPLLKRLEVFDIDINQKNDEGNTALHLAAMSTENGETLRYLIEQGADIEARTDFEETVYDLAKENELLRQQQVQLDFLKL